MIRTSPKDVSRDIAGPELTARNIGHIIGQDELQRHALGSYQRISQKFYIIGLEIIVAAVSHCVGNIDSDISKGVNAEPLSLYKIGAFSCNGINKTTLRRFAIKVNDAVDQIWVCNVYVINHIRNLGILFRLKFERGF